MTPSHTPWEEKQLQNALVDWTITQDLSFLDVTLRATQGLLTWNKTTLLHTLPKSATALSDYIKKQLETRKSEVADLLESARSNITIMGVLYFTKGS